MANAKTDLLEKPKRNFGQLPVRQVIRNRIRDFVRTHSSVLDYRVVHAGRQRTKRIGLYGFGTCHTRAFLFCGPFIKPIFDGTCGILRDGQISQARTDIILQSLEGVPEEQVKETMERLELPSWYFKPRLFEKTFEIRGQGEFPKTVIGLSVAPDLLRTVYRHREHGFLVDPGGWWLGRPAGDVLKDLSGARWFHQNFENIGKIDVETFINNLKAIIPLVRTHTKAQVLLLNTLVFTPDSEIYNFQRMDDWVDIRQREFNLAVFELAREIDVPIIDVDRILKQEGVQGQLDFAHWPRKKWEPVAREMARVMQDLEVFTNA